MDCQKLVRQLKRLGITITLDDFGTGYSSLSYLTMIQIDKIKINQSFTANMIERPDCAAIVAAVLGLAHGDRQKIVAVLSLARAHGLNVIPRVGCNNPGRALMAGFRSRPRSLR